MKIAVISDIHGNLTALETILPAIGRADQVICLGDVAATGPQPHETIAFLRKMKWPCVLGNADEELTIPVYKDHDAMDAPEEERRRLTELSKWTRAQLDSSDRQFLSGFKRTITIKGGRDSLFCYHGSPRSNTEGIPATMPDGQLAKVLGKRGATIFAGGHTHAQMFRRLEGSIIMNPGSVGLPIENDSTRKIRNPLRAEYSIVTFDGQNLSVELRRAHYGLAELEKAVRRSSLPNPDWWLADWF